MGRDQRLENVEAVLAPEGEIEEHDVRCLPFSGRDRVAYGGGAGHREPALLEQHAQRAHHESTVLDEQDAHWHAQAGTPAGSVK